jgi:hypothetical protein
MNMSEETFENSPEHDEWIETGGRDEEYSEYYQAWARRIRIEDIENSQK